MPSEFKEFDCNRLKRHEIGQQSRNVDIDKAAVPWKPGNAVSELISSLPDILAGSDLKATVEAITTAVKEHRPVVMAMGAHVIKCGLSPVIADLIARGIITAIAMNGAGAVHDTEIALFGRTSEDVAVRLQDGAFGMGIETADLVNAAVVDGQANGRGFGESLGRMLVDKPAPHADKSLFAAAANAGIPATVHVAIGTDIVHMHPCADGAAIGDCSMRDFRIFAACIEDLARRGGVLINAGSAVVLPEVVLKSLAMAANIGCSFDKLFTVNLDFIRQYRAEQQIVNRVKVLGGKAVSLTGHHEIMLPLIAAAVIESQED